MRKNKPEENIDVKSLIALDRYLAILLEEYPRPVKASVLAEKTGKSKPAISKIRDKLLQVCDTNAMLFHKGFLLSSDLKSLQGLFFVFAATGRHRKFLSSKLVRSFISRRAIHPRIIKEYPLYEKYFTEKDTEFMLIKILDAMAKIDPKDLEAILKSYVLKSPTILAATSIPDIEPIIKQIEFKFKNKVELEQMFKLRDKFYLFIRETLWAQIPTMSILDTVATSEKKFYTRVYKHTIDYYLRRLFASINEPLVKQTKKLSLNEEEFPLEVGSTILEDLK